VKKTTRFIGYLVLALSEFLILYAFFIRKEPGLLGYQITLFVTVWGAVGFKNYVDIKNPGAGK
jgi:hypothetical protein